MTLEDRIRHLEDLEAIRSLIHAYARICDTGFNGTDMARLFAPDGVWECNFGFRLTSHAEIADFFDDQTRTKFALHFYTNMQTDVTGDRARGRCLLLQTCSDLQEDGTPRGTLMTGDYLNDYVRTPDGWKFAHVRLNQRFRVASDKDWGEASLDTPTLG